MDSQNPPPANGGMTPSIPPEIGQELSQIAQQTKELHVKMTEMLKKLGVDQQPEQPDANSPNNQMGF